MCLCVRGWQTMIRLEDVSGTAGSKRQPGFFLGAGREGAGVGARNKQTRSTHSKTG